MSNTASEEPLSGIFLQTGCSLSCC